MSHEKSKPRKIQEVMPSAEEVQRELSKAKSMDDFFGEGRHLCEAICAHNRGDAGNGAQRMNTWAMSRTK
jgi:hypothetical protein